MFREAGRQVSSVIMSHLSTRTAVPPCLPVGIKDSLKEDTRLFGLGFLLEAFAFGLLLFG
jgi:hypothetical protein